MHITSGYSAHPTRSVAVGAAALANLVALAMAEGRPDEAEVLVQQLSNEYPDNPLPYEVLGWVRFEAGHKVKARKAWKQAQALSKDDAAKNVYARWLPGLTGA